VKVKPLPSVLSLPAGHITSLVDDELTRFLAEQRRDIGSLAPEAAALIDEIQRTVRAGGKRLRPLFCFWGHRASGGLEGPEIIRAAAAIELLHTSAIVHDDVVDRSQVRRGQPTAFKALGVGSGDRYGRAAAILAGDMAQAMADTLLAAAGFPPDRLMAAFVHFNRMRVEAVSGELLDLVAMRRGAASEADARRVAALKSGSYTVVGPLLVGAALAGADRALEEALRAYGRPLGEAFQLRDDVLGTFGDPALTGKDRDADIREGKQTALLSKARGLGSEPVRRLLADAVGKPEASPGRVEEVRLAIRDSGALEATIELIGSLGARAKVAVSSATLDPEAGRALETLADLVTLRDA
jgi:geranylgeranyl diphosphate synthase type I